MIKHYDLSNLIITNQELFLNSKFWLLLCDFFGIQQKLSITFYLQINGQIKRQNSIMKAYL